MGDGGGGGRCGWGWGGDWDLESRETRKVTEGNAVGIWTLVGAPVPPHDLHPTRRTMEHRLRQRSAHAINRFCVFIKHILAVWRKYKNMTRQAFLNIWWRRNIHYFICAYLLQVARQKCSGDVELPLRPIVLRSFRCWPLIDIGYWLAVYVDSGKRVVHLDHGVQHLSACTGCCISSTRIIGDLVFLLHVHSPNLCSCLLITPTPSLPSNNVGRQLSTTWARYENWE
jgi:hypothetical protein